MNNLKQKIFEAVRDGHNLDRLHEMQVTQRYGLVDVRAIDLREMLFRVADNSMVTISTELLYHLLVHHGVLIKGFKPDKTHLRQRMMLPIERVNELIPGAFKSNKPGAQKKGNVK